MDDRVDFFRYFSFSFSCSTWNLKKQKITFFYEASEEGTKLERFSVPDETRERTEFNLGEKNHYR